MSVLRGMYLWLSLWLMALPAQAAPVLIPDANSNDRFDLSAWSYINTTADFDDLAQASRAPANQWRRLSDEERRHIGVDKLWLTFSLFSDKTRLTRIIALDNPLLDKIKLFHLINDELVDVQEMGDSLPFYHRPLQSNIFLYPFEIEAGDKHTFYLQISSQGGMYLPLSLWSANELAQRTESSSLISGFQLGGLAAIGLFSLFIALASGSFSYSYYAGYVLSMSLLVATLNGIAFRFLWPDWPELQQLMVPLLIPLVTAFALMFTEKVLQLKYQSIRMLRFCRIGAVYALLQLALVPFMDTATLLYIEVVSVLLISSILMVTAIRQAVRGHKLAKLYSIGWLGLLLGALGSSMIYLGLVHIDIMSQTPVMIGLSFEIVFMAAVLAIRYNDERKAKLKIQQEALQQAERIRITREEALRAEASSKERLEKMVQERTLELEVTLRELNEVNQKLTEQTTIDSLTGVKNRNAFDKRLIAEGRISRRQQAPMALLMVDIDRFKAINDNFGHLAGDQTLRTIAACLQQNIKRPTDLVSRFGGEEFAIILPNTSVEGGITVAEMIRTSVNALVIDWEGDAIPLTVSIGVSAEVIASDTHPTALLEQADKALYQAKNTGRNRVCRYSPPQDRTQPS
ncbi:diguanylate cyclase [Shewanella sp. AS16]|uniref:sensor domain-containing diguanylate cyclase n=1 Tax=Shewanella sp. AS16 TaxID=2907625 RepID=UPI001F3F9E56|nr:diguanylate cyclase [Shewanella sp. AS16]MCE9685951.1 diguanylate cyclase [Shewanella sp. AS16]